MIKLRMNVSEVGIQPRNLEDDKLRIQSLQAVAARRKITTEKNQEHSSGAAVCRDR